MKIQDKEEITETTAINEFNPKTFKCPHCGSKGETALLKEASFLTYFASLITLFLFGFFSIILLPLIVQSSKTIVRRCSDCYEIIEQHDLFRIPSLSDEVFNFRCGNCAFVISRKYMLGLLFFLVMFYFYRTIINPPPPKYKEINATWKEYIEDCGKNLFLDNGVRAKKNFEEKYKNNWVVWEGAYLKMDSKNEIYTNSVEHRHLYIKMIPTESAHEFPDITLRVDNPIYRDYIKIFEKLNVGDIINFKGQFSHIGDEFTFHFLILMEIQDTNRNIDISNIEIIKLNENKAIGNLRKDNKKPSN